jgi:hypothetical protein
MRRSEALAGIALASLAALPACAPTSSAVIATKGSPLFPTAFGSQIYPSDDIAKTLPLLAACGTTLLRVNVNNGDFGYFDALFAAATAHGMRVIAISQYASQPVDVAAYVADAVTFHRRYAALNPIWELWNEPNLAHYWGAPPDLNAYAKLAIATATALRNAGAREILSGGTSGIDLNWIYGLRIRGVFDVVSGCAVHHYKKPVLNEYLQAGSLLPPGVALYTTEACVVDSGGPSSFLRDLWYVHRYLGLPALIWCEFRDGTAGSSPPYTDPMGLVTADYIRKPAYYVAQSLVNTP